MDNDTKLEYIMAPVKLPVNDLNLVDTHILKLMGDQVLLEDRPIDPAANRQTVNTSVISIGIQQPSIDESLTILAHRGYLLASPDVLTFTDYGFQTYVQTFISNYADIDRAIGLAIVNKSVPFGSLATELRLPSVLVNQVLDRLTAEGYINAVKTLGPARLLVRVSPELKRRYQ